MTTALIPEYPNISQLLAGMPDGMRQVGLLYMQLLPPESLSEIESGLPALVAMNDADNDAGIAALLMGFGLDESAALALTELRHESDT
jgi:hypothetical protein